MPQVLQGGRDPPKSGRFSERPYGKNLSEGYFETVSSCLSLEDGKDAPPHRVIAPFLILLLAIGVMVQLAQGFPLREPVFSRSSSFCFR